MGTCSHEDIKYEREKKIIRSQLFLKEKFLPNGALDKLKARIVAGGNQRDRSLHDDVSSLTAMIQSIFMILSIAAFEKRNVVTVDIGGAYLNTTMPTKVYIYTYIYI